MRRTLLAVGFAMAAACVADQPLVSDGPLSAPDGGFDAGGPTLGDGGAFCGAALCACNNGVDDDGDGLFDGLDPECSAPFDDDESSFATGIPGDNRDPRCQDCFFDGNSGSGDDGCRYATNCLRDGTPGSLAGACATCEIDGACRDGCLPRTPNGCDCFGCCSVDSSFGALFVQLGEGCSIERLDDPAACPRCVPAPSCQNRCGRCELCLGRGVDDLPEDCRGTVRCDDGEEVCASSADCAVGLTCHLGCCLRTLI